MPIAVKQLPDTVPEPRKPRRAHVVLAAAAGVLVAVGAAGLRSETHTAPAHTANASIDPALTTTTLPPGCPSRSSVLPACRTTEAPAH